MPFSRTNIKVDVEDIGAVFDGAPGLELRAATKPLELEQSALLVTGARISATACATTSTAGATGGTTRSPRPGSSARRAR